METWDFVPGRIWVQTLNDEMRQLGAAVWRTSEPGNMFLEDIKKPQSSLLQDVQIKPFHSVPVQSHELDNTTWLEPSP